MRHWLAVFLAITVSCTQAPRDRAKQEMKKFGHGEGKLKPGDAAPDFTLKRLNGEQTDTLSAFRGKRPVALVFGSYT